jgi:hypothetical protein
MLGIKMRPVAVSVLFSAFAFTAQSPASAATIFLPMSVVSGSVPLSAINVPTRTVIAENVPEVLQARSTRQQPKDQVPTMWAMLTGSFALIGTVMRRKNRSPSVTA